MMLIPMSKEMYPNKRLISHVATDAFYRHYCLSTFKELKGKKSIVHRDSKFCIDKKTYSNIVSDFNSAVAQEMIFDNFEYKLPARMGTLSIKKKKPKVYIDDEGKIINRMPIDWKATKELWDEDEESKEQKKLVRHTNEHTQGFIPFWYYNAYHGNFRYKTVYRFKATRTHNRFLAKVLKDPNININFYLK